MVGFEFSSSNRAKLIMGLFGHIRNQIVNRSDSKPNKISIEFKPKVQLMISSVINLMDHLSQID